MIFPDVGPLIAPTPWAAVGAAATRRYMPERMTDDLDILVPSADGPTVRAALVEAGAIYQSELSIGGSSWRLPSGFPLDVIESAEPWVLKALAEAAAMRSEDSMPVLPLPYLTLMKYRASRVQDIADITRMLGQAEESLLQEVRHVFTEWLPTEMDDLESLIQLGKLEMAE